MTEAWIGKTGGRISLWRHSERHWDWPLGMGKKRGFIQKEALDWSHESETAIECFWCGWTGDLWPVLR